MRISDWSSDVCSSDLRQACSSFTISATEPATRSALASQDSSSISGAGCATFLTQRARNIRSEEHTSELQSLMRISYAVFCLKKKKKTAITYKHNYMQQTCRQHNDILTHFDSH